MYHNPPIRYRGLFILKSHVRGVPQRGNPSPLREHSATGYIFSLYRQDGSAYLDCIPIICKWVVKHCMKYNATHPQKSNVLFYVSFVSVCSVSL